MSARFINRPYTHLQSDFEGLLLSVYHRHVRRASFERRIQFFTKYAEDVYNSKGFFVPLKPVSVSDFEGYDLNQNSYAWLKAVVPAVYGGLLRDEELLEIARGKISNITKVRMIRELAPFLDMSIRDMSKGKPVNTRFVLALEKLFFDIISESSRFVDADVIGNERRFRELLVTFRGHSGGEQQVQDEEFEGVRYSAYPSGVYDFLELDNDDVSTIGDLIMSFDGVESMEIEGEPMKMGEVLSEPSVVMPLSILDDKDLRRILREAYNIDKAEYKPIKSLIKSIFFKREKWCLFLDGTTLRFLVPKDTLLLRSGNIRGSGHDEHQSQT